MSKHEHIRKRFDEVFDLQMGKTPDRKTLSLFGGENIWLSIKDMGAKYLKDSNEHITDEAVKVSGIKKVKKGTVVMSFKLTVGKCGIAAVDLFTNEAIMAFNVKDGFNIKNDFLYYYLQGYKWQGANKAVMGLTLNKATISKQRISIPPMAEQEAIVAELDEINEAIEALQQQVADLDTLAKATFYEMFGDPVTNPHSWPVKKLGDVATSKIGLTYKPTDVNNDGIVVLRSSNIQNSIIDLNDIVRVQAKVPPEKIVRPNDILMCTRNGSFRLVGKVALISNIDEEMTYGAFMTVIRSNYYHYLFQYFKSPSYRLQLGSAKTTTINQITVKMLNELSLPIPPLALQREFAERVEAIEAAKAELSAQIAEMQTLLASRMDFWFAPNQPGDP